MLKKELKNLKETLQEEHDGFVITVEVLCTLVMIYLFLFVMLYSLRVMNTQRYMNTVLTSTATAASRWGGVNSRPYRLNVSTTPLLTTAQQQLNYVAGDYNPIITGSPSYVTSYSSPITIQIKYTLPSVFETFGRVTSNTGSQADMYNRTRNLGMSMTVYSVMRGGKLSSSY